MKPEEAAFTEAVPANLTLRLVPETGLEFSGNSSLLRRVLPRLVEARVRSLLSEVLDSLELDAVGLRLGKQCEDSGVVGDTGIELPFYEKSQGAWVVPLLCADSGDVWEVEFSVVVHTEVKQTKKVVRG